MTGGAPEVGLGDPGPCVPAPASWLWRGRKSGRFSGGPRPAAPPRFLPAPRARPAPLLPSPSRGPPGPSLPRSARDPRAPARPRPDPARPLPPGPARGPRSAARGDATASRRGWGRVPSRVRPRLRGSLPALRLCVSLGLPLSPPRCISVRVPLSVSFAPFQSWGLSLPLPVVPLFRGRFLPRSASLPISASLHRHLSHFPTSRFAWSLRGQPLSVLISAESSFFSLSSLRPYLSASVFLSSLSQKLCISVHLCH